MVGALSCWRSTGWSNESGWSSGDAECPDSRGAVAAVAGAAGPSIIYAWLLGRAQDQSVGYWCPPNDGRVLVQMEGVLVQMEGVLVQMEGVMGQMEGSWGSH